MTIWQLEFKLKTYCKENEIKPTKFITDNKNKTIHIESPTHKIHAFYTSKGLRIKVNGRFARI